MAKRLVCLTAVTKKVTSQKSVLHLSGFGATQVTCITSVTFRFKTGGPNTGGPNIVSGIGTTGAPGAGDPPLYFLGLAPRKSVGVAAPMCFLRMRVEPPFVRTSSYATDCVALILSYHVTLGFQNSGCMLN